MEPELVSEQHLFPPTEGTQKIVPLSILDCTTVRFALTCATWIYDAPDTEVAIRAADPKHLEGSLDHTLASYPQWAGQLFWNTYDPTNSQGHTHRHGRIAIKYGAGRAGGEPGVGFFVVKLPVPVTTLVPSAAERASMNDGAWLIDEQLPSHALLSPELVAFQDNVTHLGVPGVSIQVTQFADGGYAIGIKMCHALADAASLVTFMHDWARVNRAMAANAPVPTLDPVFDPSLLDSCEAGSIDASKPDLTIVERARQLPLHRYDWFLSGGPSCPPPLLPFTQPPPDLDISHDGAHVRGVPCPWHEWDMSVPVRHTILHFSAAEIRAMHVRASAAAEEQRLSKLDALLAHVWTCILRARQLDVDETAFIDVTFGFRPRLGLPPTFLGSPIRLTAIETSASAIAEPATALPHLAQRIRSTLDRFTHSACADILHDLAHEPTAQNIWATFLGRRHTLMTSWTKLGLYNVDFAGRGEAPRYVDAMMPASDGLLQVSESAPGDGKVRGGEEAAEVGDWTRDGASVSLHLRMDVMERLCKDPLLRAYK
ncbi:hypothetical protein NliqN6_1303 [Naganishia liquefaciens]|uniref:Transferase n=1 Tax=Naganishia liquefaciens TaxID=104408 RepID=A0A8H3TPD7_9TREE|nr:hypothetical protein NliqN6_1303 [Naganishia liquefaciens]